MSDNITLPREVVEKAIKAFENGCPPTCENGMIDSGGFHPWGEPALVPCPACLAFEHLRAALAAPCLEVTVDPRLTPDEAAAISSALVAAHEREACAKVCDAEVAQINLTRGSRAELVARMVAGICAAAIRARGEVPR